MVNDTSSHVIDHLTGGSNRGIIETLSGSGCSQSTEPHTAIINLQPNRKTTGVHDLVILTMGARWREPVAGNHYVECRGGRFRVESFGLIANNAGKVPKRPPKVFHYQRFTTQGAPLFVDGATGVLQFRVELQKLYQSFI